MHMFIAWLMELGSNATDYLKTLESFPCLTCAAQKDDANLKSMTFTPIQYPGSFDSLELLPAAPLARAMSHCEERSNCRRTREEQSRKSSIARGTVGAQDQNLRFPEHFKSKLAIRTNDQHIEHREHHHDLHYHL